MEAVLILNLIVFAILTAIMVFLTVHDERYEDHEEEIGGKDKNLREYKEVA